MPKVGLLSPTIEKRFWMKVRKTKDCWMWVGAKVNAKYGKLYIGKYEDGISIFKGAHAISWNLYHGRIPVDMNVLHHCDNPSCVNPRHLFLGTSLDNERDKIAKGRHHNQKKTHCPQGHPYAGENLVINNAGDRVCRTCRNNGVRAWRVRFASGVAIES